jgi:hypothetical protein
VCFVSASRQNVFFGELLDALADALTEHGVEVERAIDFFPEPRAGMAYVFVPHELLPLLMDDAHPDARQLARSVAVCTEQPGTHWFDEAAQAAQRAACAVDINRVGVSALRGLGVDARFLQLGYTPRWDRWGGARDSPRPVDVALLAGATPRRLSAVARCAAQLAELETELRLPEALVPHMAESEQFLSGESKWGLLSRSKLLLNVHRGELGYFEWQRAVEAMCNGCVLLSEHSLGFEPLVPGEQFFSVSRDSLDVALEALVHDEQRVAAVCDAAYAFVREHPLTDSVSVLADAVAEAGRMPLATTPHERARLPRPKPPNGPPPAWQLARAEGELDGVRSAVARLTLEHDRTSASVRALERTAHDRGAGEVIERLGAERAQAPRVSVLLTIADEAASVGRAIELLAVSAFTDYELVIIDDGSSDGSGNRVRAGLARAPWLSATLLTRADRGGIAQARNTAVELAVGDLVLAMDARDAPYPHGLGRLVAALERDRSASFAYGIVEQDDATGPCGLAGHLGWDPDVLRYGDFVSTMALIRRRALLDAGGYQTDPRLAGWEDLALWCAFADRGWSGAHAPEIVGRRRVELAGPAGPTTVDPSTAWSVLLRRFACLSSSVAA